MNKQITVTINGKPKLAVAGSTLSEITNGEKPCGGHGKCGKCKVIAKGEISEPGEAELKLLSSDEFANGVRLACLTNAIGNCEVTTLSHDEKFQIVTDGVLPEFELAPSFSNYGAAIDIGTTTLAARLYDTKGNILVDTSRLNPQQEWGADVVSRVEAALSGKGVLLAEAIRISLNDIILELASKIHIDPKSIDYIVITGNTVMLSLLVGESVEPFSRAPFDVKRLFGETLTASELELWNLRPDTNIYLPPCISAFVGADTTCAILATQLCTGKTQMMADIGTNGELTIWHDDRLTVCSTAAGPAFEGVGISMGMRGSVGAIDKVAVSEGELRVHVIGDGIATGICGSGLVDAVSYMLNNEILDESGFLEDESFVLREPVSITQKDIRMLQLAKSAICAGLLTLIKNEGLTPSDISTLYIAGGFGNYLNIESAAKIGLLPKALSEVSNVVGNAALGGASMLLLNSKLTTIAESMSRNAHILDLSTSPTFSEYYMLGMSFEKAE